MIKKIKENKKAICISLLTLVGIMLSFFIIYKLSSSLFLIITGSIILLIASFIKDPEIKEVKNDELNNLNYLEIFSEGVLEPAILENCESIKEKHKKVARANSKKKRSNTINIDNTASYKFDINHKKVKKTKKIKI